MSADDPPRDATDTLGGFDPPTAIEGGAGDRFVLRLADRDQALPRGRHLIGRATECEVMLDDPLVSRKHAALIVEAERVIVDDLGSVNGVYANGRRISGPTPIRSGDRLVIGKHEMILIGMRTTDTSPRGPKRPSAPTLTNMEQVPGWPPAPPSGTDITPGAAPVIRDGPPSEDEHSETTKGDALDLLGGVADKVLALGRGDEAERILAAYLENALRRAEEERSVDAQMSDKAASYAIKLASATGKGSWVDYCLRLFTIRRYPLPKDVVDDLYTVLRKVSAIDLQVLRSYIAVLQAEQRRYGPSERFVVQRIEGLERLAALK